VASLGENIIDFIESSTAVAAEFQNVGADITEAGRVYQTFSSNSKPPRIYIRRAQQNKDIALDGNGGLIISSWDVEVYGKDEDNAVDTAAVVKDLLHGHRGTMGTETVQAVFVLDHDDDYTWKGAGTSTGFFAAALDVQIFSN